MEREMSPLGETEAQNDKLACLLKVTQLINARWDHLGPSSFSLGMTTQLAIMVTCLKQQQQPANSYHATGNPCRFGATFVHKIKTPCSYTDQASHYTRQSIVSNQGICKEKKKNPARYQENIEDRFQAEKWG